MSGAIHSRVDATTSLQFMSSIAMSVMYQSQRHLHHRRRIHSYVAKVVVLEHVVLIVDVRFCDVWCNMIEFVRSLKVREQQQRCTTLMLVFTH